MESCNNLNENAVGYMAQLENKPVLEAQLDEALSILRELKAQQIVSYERRVAESISLREETEKKLTVFKKEVAERSSAICKKTSDTRKAVMKELDVLCTEVEYFDAQQHQMIQKERAVKENIKNRRWSEDNYAIFGTGKIFYSRNSKLSELLRVSEFQTIYNIFVAVLVLFLISIMLKNHFEHGNAINFSLLIWAFGKLEYVAVVWFAMQLAVFAAFSFKHMILNDFPAPFIIALYVVFQLLFFAVPAGACLKLSLPPASGFIVMCELVRMAMKVHSFVRVMFVTKTKRDNQTKENLKVILRQKQGQERNSYEKTENNRESEDYLSNIIKSKFDYVKKEKDEHPFEHYVYFLFCPTLLYRSVYPRTPKIRWSHVVHHLLETASCTFYTYVVFERYCIPEYRKAAQEPYSFETFVLSIFSSMLPATLVMLLGFFGILHSWLNAFAEITQFADREFYSDWWNAKSFSEYYRKWNGVIYDWLHDYAYRDVVGYCTVKLQLEKQKARLIGSLVVIWISSIVHEYIISCAIGFFYPILLLQFAGPGLIFIYLTLAFKEHRFSNLFMWTMLFLGNGLLMILYSREWYARHSGSIENDWYSFFRPHSLGFLLQSQTIVNK